MNYGKCRGCRSYVSYRKLFDNITKRPKTNNIMGVIIFQYELFVILVWYSLWAGTQFNSELHNNVLLLLCKVTSPWVLGTWWAKATTDSANEQKQCLVVTVKNTPYKAESDLPAEAKIMTERWSQVKHLTLWPLHSMQVCALSTAHHSTGKDCSKKYLFFPWF